MTDNEIRPYDGMTTLEQLNLYRNLHYCEGLANERGIIANAINDIIVQFNRQKAEIENYSHNNRNMTKDIRTLQKALELATAKIERLKAERDKEHDYCNHYARMCAKAKAEAIKEFAERLDARKKKRACVWSAEYEETVTISEINNLVEELVGDCDGSSKKM